MSGTKHSVPGWWSIMPALRDLGSHASAVQLSEATGQTDNQARDMANKAAAAGAVRREAERGPHGIMLYTALIDADGTPWTPRQDARRIGQRGRERACNWCGQSFWSQHAGHRRCDDCRRAVGQHEETGWVPDSWAEVLA
jgi:hypothetical protein